MAHGKVSLLVLLAWLASACSDGMISGPMNNGPVCGPGAGGPFWLTEGESIDITVACQKADAEPLGGDRFILEGLPAGATYDPASAMISFTPGLDQAAVYDITVKAADLDESGTVRIGVADRFDDPENVPIVDPLAYPLEYGVPVFHLSPPPEDPDVYASTQIIYGGHAYAAQAKKRGRTSIDYPKNSYTLEFPAADRFSDPERAGGFAKKHKIVLTQHFDDNSYIRTRLALDMWNDLAPSVTMQSYTAVVYLDGQYWGLYTVSDHVDDDLMAEHGLPKSGNLYKAINHDANFRLVRKNGSDKLTLHDGYEKKSGMPDEGMPGAFDDIDELVQFAATSSDGDFATQIGQRIDVADYIRWLVLAVFIAADDSGGKNSYHFHSPGALWKVVPWDFNASLGQTFSTRRRSSTIVDYFDWTNEIFVRMLANPVLTEMVAQQFRQALAGPYTMDTLNKRIDSYLAEIPAQVVARDQARWGATMMSYTLWDDRTDFTTPEQEVTYMREWLAQRVATFAALY